MSHLRAIFLGNDPATLEGRLHRLGHELAAHSARMSDTAPLVQRHRPDLVMVDVALAGPAGADAESVLNEFRLPVVIWSDCELGPAPSPLIPHASVGLADADLDQTLRLAVRLHRAEETVRRQEVQIQDTATNHQCASDRFQQLRRAVENCPAAIVITDVFGSIEYVNPHFERVTGFTFAEAIGQNPRVLKSGSQDAEFYRDLWATLQRGETWSGEFHNRRKDGTLFWERASISPMRNPAGTITHFVAVKEDITAAREARIELVRARDEAEAANRAKGAFLATMSHELRTPLNVISGAAATLLEESLPPRVREVLSLSVQSSQHLLSIIEDILDFSSLQAGKVRLVLKDFDLVPLLEQVLRQAAALPAARRLTLTLSVDSAVPSRIVGDARRLRQILLNLLANAVKFTSEGAVHLSVRARRGRTGRPGLHCSIVDTGPGMTPEQRKIIFLPFTQADDSIARRYGGTGLGLAISRTYVKLMGGELNVRSRPGIGSAFHFSFDCNPALPAAPVARLHRRRITGGPQPVAAAAPAPAFPQIPMQGALAREMPLRILVADDVETNRYVVDMMLRQMGYTCRLVEDGAAAIAALQSSFFDLVLLDVQMPVIDGIAAAREICRLFPDVAHRPRLVALTANALPTNRDACIQAGVDSFLTKPLRPATLVACIRNLFARKSAPASSVQADSRSPARLASAATPPAGELLNTFQLRTLTLGLPENTGAETLRRIHEVALDDFGEARDKVQSACTQRDRAALHCVVHGLKGCFSTLGWDHAAALCRDTIAELNAGTFSAWADFPAELQRRFASSDAAMTRFLAETYPLNPPITCQPTK